MEPSCTGTIIVRTTTPSRMLLPRNLSLEKAKPASEEKITTETVIVPATITLLISALAKSTSGASKSFWTLLLRCVPGVNGGGSATISSFVREASTTIQYSGKADSTNVITRTM